MSEELSPVQHSFREARETHKASKIIPHEAYQQDPIGWIRDKLGIPEWSIRWSLRKEYANHRWDGDQDPLALVCKAIADWKDVGVESGTGTGKSFLAACIILWFLACFRDALVFTFAPKEEQLRKFIWKEIGKLWPRFKRHFPKAELLDLQIRMAPGKEGWGATGYAVGVKAGEQSATKAQGMHAEHMLLVYEEMPGIDPAVVEAGKNTATAPHNLRLGLGNPDHQLDTLHRFCVSFGVTPVRVSGYDHPNVVSGDASLIPGAVSRKWIDGKVAEEGEDSPMFKSRVRGISPEEAFDALVKKAWLEDAADKWENMAQHQRMRLGARALGVDPAQSENGDRCALARWEGCVLISVEKVPSSNALEFGEYIHAVMNSENVAASRVAVDSVGVGSNVVNHLRKVLPPGQWVKSIEGGAEDAVGNVMKAAVRPLGNLFAEFEPDANKYLNMRAQVYWQFREDLQRGLVAIPRDMKLWRELMAVTYRIENGVVRMEKKAEIKKKLGYSPDFADAVVYGSWVRDRPERPDKQAGRSREAIVFEQDNRHPGIVSKRPQGGYKMPPMNWKVVSPWGAPRR